MNEVQSESGSTERFRAKAARLKGEEDEIARQGRIRRRGKNSPIGSRTGQPIELDKKEARRPAQICSPSALVRVEELEEFTPQKGVEQG